MAYKNQDFEVWQGDDFKLNYNVDGVQAAEDLTAAKWAISRSRSGAAMLTKDSNITGEIAIDTVSNIVSVILFSADTLNLKEQKYYCELEVFDSENLRTTIAIGTMDLQPTILK
ncbi:MAG TPA: hypothetical protein VKN64_07695 [Halanaerobiales bacterium]|nr:hypothetical protein [Halanaerobiales bacterium]